MMERRGPQLDITGRLGLSTEQVHVVYSGDKTININRTASCRVAVLESNVSICNVWYVSCVVCRVSMSDPSASHSSSTVLDYL
jgi:hypothetical protein